MRRNLYLYLALACFAGLLAIFVFDGYMGLYDTVHMVTGEQRITVGPDFWIQQGQPFGPRGPVPFEGSGADYFISADRGAGISFTYEIDNRRFSAFREEVDVSVWRSQQKLRDMISQPVAVPGFAKGEVKWAIDNREIVPADFPSEQTFQYTMVIRSGGVERRIVVSLNPIFRLEKPIIQ
ncbi:MAG: hypothetical protein HYX84_03840 [Chloroflexi bacterium]|nr:hypothetical protein [Chloroflexota bacterium]